MGRVAGLCGPSLIPPPYARSADLNDAVGGDTAIAGCVRGGDYLCNAVPGYDGRQHSRQSGKEHP